MKSTITKIDDNTVKLEISVPDELFQKDIDKAFRSIAKQVNLPGFRPGKAPRAILEKRFGAEAGRQQAIQDSVPTYYVKAVNEHDIQPISQPDLNVVSGETEGDLNFEITVKVKPEIEIEGYDKLEVKVDIDPVSDDQIQDQINQFLSQYATLEDSKKALADGDVAEISIKAKMEGEDVPGLSTEDFQYDIGSKAISEKFDEELVGKKVGDSVSFTGPLSERFNENAGLEVDFEVSVKGTKTKILPELTDEWVADKTAHDSVETFKSELKKQLEKVNSVQARMQLQDKVFESLAEIVKVDVPQEMIDTEKENRIEQMNKQFAQAGISYEQFMEMAEDDVKAENEEELNKQAILSAKIDLALNYIVKKEDLNADEAEIDEIIANEAQNSKMKPAKLKNMLINNGVMRDVERDASRRKAVAFVIEHAKAFDSQGNEIEVTDISNMFDDHQGHDHDGHDHDHDHEGHDH